MKKILFSLLGALFTFGVAQAQTLSIDDVQVIPGETASFELKIDVAGGQYSGFQFQMQFPATGFTLTGTTISSEWESSTFSTGDLNSEGKANASAYSSADKAIPDGEQVIGSVKFTAASNLALGDYEVTISGFDYLDGTNYIHANNGADLTFTIHVVDVLTITLDEESTKAPVASDGEVNVIVKRTINAGDWSTICLPFDMSEEQVKSLFGDDVQLAFFSSYEIEKDGSDVTSITVNFESDDLSEGFAANYPYIIKTSKNITQFSLEEVVIDPDDVQESYSAGKGSNKISGKFIGTYEANTEIPKDKLFLSENKFWYSAGNKTMKAYRAYFDFDKVLADVANASAGVKMAIGNGDPETSIKSIDGDAFMQGESYDLSGRKVSKPQIRGIYIVDGKKVAVK